LDPKSFQEREKVVSKSLQKSTRFFIRFFNGLGSILDPPGDPKISYFSRFFSFAVGLGPSWLQEGLQSAPRHLGKSIFQEFGTILGLILEEFSKIFKLLSITQQTKKQTHEQTHRQTHEHTKPDVPRPESRSNVDPDAAPEAQRPRSPREFAVTSVSGVSPVKESIHRPPNLSKIHR